MLAQNSSGTLLAVIISQVASTCVAMILREVCLGIDKAWQLFVELLDKGPMIINKQLFLATAMLVGLSFTSLLACGSPNAQLCTASEQCEAGRDCVDGVCAVIRDAPDGAPASALADAGKPPVVCGGEGETCVATAPTGWSGPALRVDQDPGATPSCPASFQGGQVIGFDGLQAGGSCGCSCTDTTDFACTSGSIQGRDAAFNNLDACFNECTGASTCTAQFLQTGVCTTISSTVRARELLRLDAGTVFGGTCSPGTISDNLQEPNFSAQISLCLADIAPGCEEGSSCIAPAPVPFDEGMCIFQEGQHECPADSIYSERTVIFANYDDQRSCETCSCEIRSGEACGTIEVFNDDSSCSGTPINTNGPCTTMPNLISPRAKLKPYTSIECLPTANPPISGQVSGAGATTVCCAL